MITRIVNLKIEVAHKQTFEVLYRNAFPEILKMEGCHSVSLQEDISEEGNYFTISNWESEEHLNNYRNSIFFAGVWKSVKVYFSAKATAWSLVAR